jgi:hypothetical protein
MNRTQGARPAGCRACLISADRVTGWQVRGRESATITHPRPIPLTILGIGNSIGTPEVAHTHAYVVVIPRFRRASAATW